MQMGNLIDELLDFLVTGGREMRPGTCSPAEIARQALELLYASKVFGMFNRLHLPEEYEGTGVGLALVHRIISRHSGQVWAESVLGQGTTVYFTLEPSQLG